LCVPFHPCVDLAVYHKGLPHFHHQSLLSATHRQAAFSQASM
jgi:hypothetical protein